MTLLFDIELTWYQRSVTLHCSHYLQGLSFCLFFFLLKHPFPSPSPSLSLKFAPHHICSFPELHTDTSSLPLSPGGSCPNSGWFPAHHEGLTSPWWTNTWNSVSRTRWFADKTGSSKPGSVHQRWLNVDIYNSCISKARTIQKLWTLYGDENILGDRCFTLDCYCCF